MRRVGGDGRNETAPLSHWTTFFADVPEEEVGSLLLATGSDK